MKAIFKKIVRLKKRRAIKNLIAAGATAYAVKYGRMNKTTDLFLNSSQEIQSTTVQPSEALKSAFEIRGGDQHF